ncbi:MAG: Holliday junction resolvase RuvX [Candidatus Caldatribacteriaceae bacterium]
MRKIVAFDIGEKRTGVAFNRGSAIAFPYTVLEREENINSLLRLAQELGAEEIVIGLPIRTNGSLGERAQKIEALRAEIERVFSGKVVLQDERFSTKEAEKRLIEVGIKRKKRKETTDQISAALILQTYLDKENQ